MDSASRRSPKSRNAARGRPARRWPEWLPAALFVLVLAATALSPAIFLGRIPAQLDWLTAYTPWHSADNRREMGLPVEDIVPYNQTGGDSFYVYLPDRKIAVMEWKAGRWPLWNPYLAGGLSLLGYQTATPLDPLILFMLFLPTGIALGLNYALLLFLAGLGVVLLLRESGLTSRGALAVGGVAFALCPFMVIWLETRVFPAGLALIPMALWTLERWRRQPRSWQPAGILALCVGYSALAGNLQTLAILLLMVLLRVAWLWWPTRPLPGEPGPAVVERARLWPPLLAVLAGLAIGSLPIIAALEALAHSTRVANAAHYYHQTNYLPWRSLALWFNPSLFGWTKSEANTSMPVLGRTVGSVVVGGGPGIVVLLLAGIGAWSRETPRGVKLFWGGLGGGVLLLLLLLRSPLYSALTAVCPFLDGVDLLRGLVVVSLAWAVLAAWGAGHLLKRWGANPGWRGWYAALLILTGAGIALIVIARLGKPAPHPWWRDLLPLLAVSGLLLLPGRWPARADRRVWILAGMAGLELLVLHFRFNTFALPAYEYPEPASATRLSGRLGPPYYHRLLVASNWRALPPNLPSLFGFHDVRAYTDVPVARYQALIECAEGKSFSNKVVIENVRSPIYRLLGAEIVFDPLAVEDPRFERLGTSLYSRTDAMPRTFLLHDIRLAADATELKRQLADPGFDPAALGWLESSGGPPPPLGPPGAGELTRIVEYLPDRVRIRVVAGSPAMLVLADTYYPGWRARVGGAPARIYPVDYALRGVAVPAGESTVEFVYRPPWLWPGVTAGLVGLTGAAGAISGRRKRQRPGRFQSPTVLR